MSLFEKIRNSMVSTTVSVFVLLVVAILFGSRLAWNAEAYLMMDHGDVEPPEQSNFDAKVKLLRRWTDIFSGQPKKPIVRCLGAVSRPVPCQKPRSISPNSYQAWTLG
ncbi:hypothetical protein RvY_04404 [Ramazzottius varieornatus]|uniref:Uncharacterized protein n=1 Tax=Ramazzottius varieornatus TaxID=947166 RepID=A0A1D1V1I6_RAMVA|nr:hypothetical protein RvY_04404 [Ramazzottius varieornatus]